MLFKLYRSFVYEVIPMTGKKDVVPFGDYKYVSCMHLMQIYRSNLQNHLLPQTY